MINRWVIPALLILVLCLAFWVYVEWREPYDVMTQFPYIRNRPDFRPSIPGQLTLYQTNGPGGVHTIPAIAETSGRILYVGTYGEGIFASRDGGRHWRPVNRGLTDLFITTLSAADDGSVYAGTVKGGIFRSINGQEWESITTGLETLEVPVILTSPDNTLYAGTRKGVFTSKDRGENWALLGPDLKGIPVRALALGKGRVLYVGTHGEGVIRIEEGGKRWQSFTVGVMNDLGIPEGTVRSILIGRNGTVFIGTLGIGVLRMEGGGDRWTPMNAGLTNASIRSMVISREGTFFVGTGEGVFRSRDEGKNWAPVSNGLFDKTIQTLAVGGEGILYAGTGEGGLFASRDQGESWTSLNGGGLTISEVHFLSLAPDNTLFAGTRGRGVFKSEDGSGTWRSANRGLSDPFISALAVDRLEEGYTVYVGGSSGLSKSVDQGETWISLPVGLTQIQTIAPGPDHSLFIGARDGMAKGTDGGTRWETIHNTLTDVQAIVMGPDHTLYAGGGAGIIKSTDGGRTWVAVEPGLSDIRLLVVTPSHILYAVKGDQILFKGVSGQEGRVTWREVNAGLPHGAIITSLALDPREEEIVYVGTSSGLYWSDKGGGEWHPAYAENGELYTTPTLALAAHSSGLLFVGTPERGVHLAVNEIPLPHWLLRFAIRRR